MRILYVAYAPLSKQGAVPVHVGAIAGGLAKRGHEVTIIAPEFAKPFELEGVEVVFLRSRIGVAQGWARAASRWIDKRKRDFDAIYHRDFYNCNRVIGRAKKAGIPTVLEVNGLVRDELDGYGLTVWVAGTLDWRFSLRRRLGLADSVIAVSPELRDFLANLNGDESKFHFLPNGVDLGLYHFDKDKRSIRAELDLPVEGELIGNVGSILPYHLESPIVEVVEMLSKNREDLRCLIVGGGPAEDEFRAKVDSSSVRDRFIFTGRVSQKKSARYIGALDVAVTWSTPETARFCWPVRLSAFAAAGVPTVAPDWGVYRIFEENGALISAAGGTAESTANAVDRLLTDKKLAEKISHNGRKWAENALGWDSVVDRTETILKGIVKPNNRS